MSEQNRFGVDWRTAGLAVFTLAAVSLVTGVSAIFKNPGRLVFFARLLVVLPANVSLILIEPYWLFGVFGGIVGLFAEAFVLGSIATLILGTGSGYLLHPRELSDSHKRPWRTALYAGGLAFLAVVFAGTTRGCVMGIQLMHSTPTGLGTVHHGGLGGALGGGVASLFVAIPLAMPTGMLTYIVQMKRPDRRMDISIFLNNWKRISASLVVAAIAPVILPDEWILQMVAFSIAAMLIFAVVRWTNRRHDARAAKLPPDAP